MDPKQNRTVPPLRYDLVHPLKRDRPELIVELNGGLENLSACQDQLHAVDGVMGRAATPTHCNGTGWIRRSLATATPHPLRHRRCCKGASPCRAQGSSGGRLWPIARHLVHLVEGVSGARYWRRELSVEASDRSARPAVLERAMEQLQERGL